MEFRSTSQGAAREGWFEGLRRPADWDALAPVFDRLAEAHDLCVIAVDREVVGVVAFLDAPEDQRPEIGYGLVPSRRGRGLAKHALRGLQLVAERKGFSGLRAQSAANNPASGAVLAACGFEIVATTEDLERGQIHRWNWDVQKQTP